MNNAEIASDSQQRSTIKVSANLPYFWIAFVTYIAFSTVFNIVVQLSDVFEAFVQMGLLIGQLNWVAACTTLHPLSLVRRWTAVIGATACLSSGLMIGWVADGSLDIGARMTATIMLFFMLLVLSAQLPVWASRLALRIQLVDPRGRMGLAVEGSQFTIRHLFIVTFAVAVALAFGRANMEAGGNFFFRSLAFIVICFAGMFLYSGLVSLPCAFVLLGKRNVFIAVGIAVGLLVVADVLVFLAFAVDRPNTGERFWEATSFHGGFAAMVAPGFLLLRAVGFRIKRIDRECEAEQLAVGD